MSFIRRSALGGPSLGRLGVKYRAAGGAWVCRPWSGATHPTATGIPIERLCDPELERGAVAPPRILAVPTAETPMQRYLREQREAAILARIPGAAQVTPATVLAQPLPVPPRAPAPLLPAPGTLVAPAAAAEPRVAEERAGLPQVEPWYRAVPWWAWLAAGLLVWRAIPRRRS